MSGVDGFKEKNKVKVTWEQFQVWQRWDEFPERQDNPPMTVEMTFVYVDEVFYLNTINKKYVILTDDWKPVAEDDNFLKLLNTPINEWSGKSFCELIEQFYFIN